MSIFAYKKGNQYAVSLAPAADRYWFIESGGKKVELDQAPIFSEWKRLETMDDCRQLLHCINRASLHFIKDPVLGHNLKMIRNTLQGIVKILTQ